LNEKFRFSPHNHILGLAFFKTEEQGVDMRKEDDLSVERKKISRI
jgi:hypothetical protein